MSPSGPGLPREHCSHSAESWLGNLRKDNISKLWHGVPLFSTPCAPSFSKIKHPPVACPHSGSLSPYIGRVHMPPLAVNCISNLI
ncbi:hypothetical protein XELAEV_18011091mg [Xenopus laevis]|uniref:Uncharacterized protein n=1 Tax=Xenopus laevis TaxID=8355 RepID=A0A974DXM2_XENLA|nr:hypothetical protein XELAEV_18011091mg [Xenopus laevis]